MGDCDYSSRPREEQQQQHKEEKNESFKVGGKMEGWSYRFRLHYSRKRYFALNDNRLDWFKNKPSFSSSNSDKEDPLRSAIIDSCIQVTDNGRESIHGNVRTLL